jgi:hypothetical protein
VIPTERRVPHLRALIIAGKIVKDRRCALLALGIGSAILVSCGRDVYKPPTHRPGSILVRVVDDHGDPVQNAFFIPGTETRVQAPGGLAPENVSDAKGYAVPQTEGQPVLLVTKKGYEPVVLRVDSIPTNDTLTVRLRTRSGRN